MSPQSDIFWVIADQQNTHIYRHWPDFIFIFIACANYCLSLHIIQTWVPSLLNLIKNIIEGDKPDIPISAWYPEISLWTKGRPIYHYFWIIFLFSSIYSLPHSFPFLWGVFLIYRVLSLFLQNKSSNCKLPVKSFLGRQHFDLYYFHQKSEH